jgi:hypothetical protein
MTKEEKAQFIEDYFAILKRLHHLYTTHLAPEYAKDAADIARSTYESDDVYVGEDPVVEKTMAGAWVDAKVFVSNADLNEYEKEDSDA